MREAGVTAALLGPAFVFLVAFVVLPVLAVGALALLNFDPLSQETSFAGLENWHRVLASPELWQATGNTLLYTALTVPVEVGGGLLIALAIRAAGRGAGLWRTAYFAPTAATLAAMSVVWRWLFYPHVGVFDETLGRLVGQDGWLSSTTLALPAVAIVGSWAGIGSCVVMFLAGLSNVPAHLEDAARMDRAGAWHRFWSVTWPAIGPATTFALVITTRDSLRVYDQVRVMTDGGPQQSTSTLSFTAWQRGVSYLDIGGGSVVNTVLLVLVLITVAVQLRLGGRRWEEDGRR
ncbi:carbohydrate ABC transporter permease [Streptomyces rugosispiralis]|uniref:Sugar ABC transporter permease n=1 Tax=Streptomyces rugosispiralis TaxID=2967341 RepID=A0ABT1VBN3_9ACTN|nr:sugar ABC transporter permease [Streptomyces rugosispiralis]MCQ8194793.1 sugar ABC transporter permease [Streptomyces rugosispiralis]